MTSIASGRILTAPRGTEISCVGWHQEAALRMLHNNLDPAVAERPEDLVVYGGSGKAARNWACFDKIVETLRRLKNDETLLVQSGKPVGVFRTHDEAPRVLIANSNLVPRWATWDEFRRLEAMGLTMYGQMTAGSWIYIGSQGILQGTYETFAECARQHFGNTLTGRLVVTGGLGGMGGAQPLAATMNGGAFLGVDVDAGRISRRVEQGYCDRMETDLDRALELVVEARARGTALSVGLVGNIADVVPELVRRGITPDVITDQTSAHDLRLGYIPVGYSLESAAVARDQDPKGYEAAVLDSMCAHVEAMLALKRRGAIAFDYGNNLRGQVADLRGMSEAFQIPGFVPEFIRPLFCRGSGPFRWAALSGDPKDIAVTDDAVLATFPEKADLQRWIAKAREKVHFQGLPARICWLEYGERAEMGQRFNWLVRKGKVQAPLVIGRDHLDTGSVASPNRETEAMKDGSDAIADWPLLNALLNTACGASWVSLHHGGGVGIGYSLHSGMVIVADGTEKGGERLMRVLTADPGTGVMRHADAGYEEAIATAAERGIDLPMLNRGNRDLPLLTNIGFLATCRPGGGQADIHAIRDAALAWNGDRVTWAGPAGQIPAAVSRLPAEDARGMAVFPGLVDCHTHLAFGGWRADEFEQRIQGASYLDIAARGGGIASTVRQTRAASEDDLEARARRWLAAMRELGITTVECKSGYGLDRDTELRLLRVYRRLAASQPTRLVSTFLGAHVVPAEFRERRGDYVRLLIDELIPAVAREGLAQCCDVFVERSAFTPEEARDILGAALRAGLLPKLHADQLSDGGGGLLAAEVGALSADHLEHVSDAGIAAMAAAGVVAVSLPLATMYLNQPPMPARRLIDAGVAVAVATDFNPGSAPSFHLPFALTLACTLQRMTPAEALKGATIFAARAVGRESEVGSLEAGKYADFAIFDVPDATQWLYHLQANACVRTVIGGETVWRS